MDWLNKDFMDSMHSLFLSMEPYLLEFNSKINKNCSFDELRVAALNGDGDTELDKELVKEHIIKANKAKSQKEAMKHLVVVIRHLVFLHYCQLYGRLEVNPPAIELIQQVFDGVPAYYYNAIRNGINSSINDPEFKYSLRNAVIDMEQEIDPNEFRNSKLIKDALKRLVHGDISLRQIIVQSKY